MTSWWQEGRAVERVERLALADLPAGSPPSRTLQLLDVRERSEWDDGHMPGSTSLPWHDVVAVPDGLDARRPIAVLCASGQRAGVAASLLQRAGAEAVVHVVDGGVPRLGPARPPARALRAIGGRRGLRARAGARVRTRGARARRTPAGSRRAEAVDRGPEPVVGGRSLVAPALVVERGRQQDLAEVVQERGVDGPAPGRALARTTRFAAARRTAPDPGATPARRVPGLIRFG